MVTLKTCLMLSLLLTYIVFGLTTVGTIPGPDALLTNKATSVFTKWMETPLCLWFW